MGDKGGKCLDFRIRTDNGGRRWRLRRGERDGLGIKMFFF